MKTEKRILNPTSVNLFICLFVVVSLRGSYQWKNCIITELVQNYIKKRKKELTSGQHFSPLPPVVTFYNQQGILGAFSSSGAEAITYHFQTS